MYDILFLGENKNKTFSPYRQVITIIPSVRLLELPVKTDLGISFRNADNASMHISDFSVKRKSDKFSTTDNEIFVLSNTQ
jgi:hypothetical protein